MTINRCPASVGMAVEEVDTPALLVELDALQKNIGRMADAARKAKVRLRPHAKTHKCPAIALRQIAEGAIGVCCQKVSEAEAMVLGGVKDVFVSNEVVGRQKVERMVSLAKQARVSVCADDPSQIDTYSIAAQRYGAELGVLAELEVGGGRCGLEPGRALLELVLKILESPNLRFSGIHAYHGRAQHMRTSPERTRAIQYAIERVAEAKEMLEQQGVSVEIITGGGTGTYRLEASSGLYNEIQPGSYIFMDADYARNLDENGHPWVEFEHSLFVYTTVISRPGRDRAVVDAGLKAHSVDSGMPIVDQKGGLRYVAASDEHGTLLVEGPAGEIDIGDKLRLIPGHCDPTVNLYDWYVGIRKGMVECLWPITARGAVL